MIPVDDVYADVILHDCPRCKAEMGEFCTNPITHNISKIPCAKRMAFAPRPENLSDEDDDVVVIEMNNDAWAAPEQEPEW